MPATLATRRRRRIFPEHELLERLHRYEKLLRQNDIQFEPLSKDPTGGKERLKEEVGDASDDEHPEAVEADWLSPSTTIKSERAFETKYVFSRGLIQVNQAFQKPLQRLEPQGTTTSV